MNKVLIIAALLVSLTTTAQQKSVNILEARRSGVELIKAPVKGILKVDVSEEYKNIVLVYLCDYRGSLPLACREDYNVTMTTATGRVMTIKNYKDVSFGTIRPEEFPLTIDVKVKGLSGEERYPLQFTIKLQYKGFCYRVYLYDEWTEMKGINTK